MLTLDGKTSTVAPAKAPPVAPPVKAPESVPIANGDGRMIFLRRDSNNWHVSFMGIRGLSPNAMPLPFTRDESLRDVLEHLGKTYGGQLTGAWLLVAP